MKNNSEKSVERQIAEADLMNGLKAIGAEEIGTRFLELGDDEQLALTAALGLVNILKMDKADFHIIAMTLMKLMETDRLSTSMLCMAICENVKKVLLEKKR